jgi:hypothetical protein
VTRTTRRQRFGSDPRRTQFANVIVNNTARCADQHFFLQELN